MISKMRASSMYDIMVSSSISGFSNGFWTLSYWMDFSSESFKTVVEFESVSFSGLSAARVNLKSSLYTFYVGQLRL